MIANKVCPVLIRLKDDDWQIFAFHHPLAGDQLVKGSIETGEAAEIAVLRELAEESGLTSAVIIQNLGVWESGFDGQIWAIFLCEARNLPDEWIYHTKDGGGNDFTFFWYPLNSDSGEWHPLYQAALRQIRTAIQYE